jgi:hypothetical protein
VAQLLAKFKPDQTAKAVRKAVGDAGPVQVQAGTPGGDWRRMRGIPAIGRGVAGEVFGSRPDREVVRLLSP